MKPRAIVFDLDGTLVDDSHLLYLAHEPDPDYALFHILAAECMPQQWVFEDLVQAYRASRVLIITARSVEHKAKTEAWLEKWGVPYDALLMRSENDHRKDVTVKAELLDGAAYYYDIIGAYEDNLEVAAHWESLGIDTVVVTGALNG